MDIELDHILWASSNLDRGSALIKTLTAVTPARGGTHPGFGTHNSLISLGDSYLEIISPDPEQSSGDNRGKQIAMLAMPGLITFAVRTNDLASYAKAARNACIVAGDPVSMTRTRPDGIRLDWAVLQLKHPVYGEAIPFAIDWQRSPNPSVSTPKGCRLINFTVLHPEARPLTAIYRELGVPITVKGATRPGFLAVIDTPNGEVVLTSP
jgi:hypothetical protein